MAHEKKLRPWQFSLKQMLISTGGICIALAASVASVRNPHLLTTGTLLLIIPGSIGAIVGGLFDRPWTGLAIMVGLSLLCAVWMVYLQPDLLRP